MFCGKLICYLQQEKWGHHCYYLILVYSTCLQVSLHSNFSRTKKHSAIVSLGVFLKIMDHQNWYPEFENKPKHPQPFVVFGTARTSHRSCLKYVYDIRDDHRNQTWYIIQTVQTSIFHPRLIDSIDLVKRRKAGLYGICFCPLQWWPGSLGWCGCRRRRTWNAAGYTHCGAAGDAASLRGTAAGTSTLWGSFMRNHGNHVIGTIQMCIFTGREYLRMMFAWIF